jgi:aminoglycoside N3'-acetyltransferase
MTMPACVAQASAEIAAALRRNELPRSVPLVVHSGMVGLAAELHRRGLRGRDLLERSCACFADALAEALGPEGTVCVPGFFYAYARKGLTFDARTSPPDDSLGAFPHYFLGHRMQGRSLNPLVSLMTAGAQAEILAAAPSLYGYGACSPWARIVEAGGWMLFFGATPASMTFSHHVEHLAGVPHLYNKIYRVPVVDLEGRQHGWSVCSVRYLDPRFPVEYGLESFCHDLEAVDILRNGTWHGVQFSVASMQAVQQFLLEHLASDPFYLLECEPKFVRGFIPDDGPIPAGKRWSEAVALSQQAKPNSNWHRT